MLEYILASVRARLCVLAPHLSQGTVGWPYCLQLRSVCSHSGPTCQWYAKRRCVDRLTIHVLGFAPSYYSSLRHSLPGMLHYDAFLSMHFHHQRDFRCVWFNAQLIRAWKLQSSPQFSLSMYSVLLWSGVSACMCVPGVEALHACVYALFPLVIDAVL